eukprot:2573659-Pleurochrysis_carterae.AAC.2
MGCACLREADMRYRGEGKTRRRRERPHTTMEQTRHEPREERSGESEEGRRDGPAKPATS